ncbi:hypothetical protein [Horticoccus sp. 23ND18S-11]|uniref:hypothetical protein n=1 Tax=Horticoccus sp. 23ND18S-11 TaxID=3391832 RepID=UPI0039C8D5D1
MPDRLAELVRQRALVEEHLAWLNRQIADAALQSPAPGTLPIKPAIAETTVVESSPRLLTPVTPPPRAPLEFAPATADAEAIIAKYQIPSSALKDDVRKGCFLYFAAAFVVLGLGVTLLYLMVSRR